MNSNKNIFYEQQLLAMKLLDVFNPEVRERLNSLGEKSKMKRVLPAPENIYSKDIVKERDPLLLKKGKQQTLSSSATKGYSNQQRGIIGGPSGKKKFDWDNNNQFYDKGNYKYEDYNENDNYYYEDEKEKEKERESENEQEKIMNKTKSSKECTTQKQEEKGCNLDLKKGNSSVNPNQSTKIKLTYSNNNKNAKDNLEAILSNSNNQTAASTTTGGGRKKPAACRVIENEIRGRQENKYGELKDNTEKYEGKISNFIPNTTTNNKGQVLKQQVYKIREVHKEGDIEIINSCTTMTLINNKFQPHPYKEKEEEIEATSTEAWKEESFSFTENKSMTKESQGSSKVKDKERKSNYNNSSNRGDYRDFKDEGISSIGYSNNLQKSLDTQKEISIGQEKEEILDKKEENENNSINDNTNDFIEEMSLLKSLSLPNQRTVSYEDENKKLFRKREKSRFVFVESNQIIDNNQQPQVSLSKATSTIVNNNTTINKSKNSKSKGNNSINKLDDKANNTNNNSSNNKFYNEYSTTINTNNKENAGNQELNNSLDILPDSISDIIQKKTSKFLFFKNFNNQYTNTEDSFFFEKEMNTLNNSWVQFLKKSESKKEKA